MLLVIAVGCVVSAPPTFGATANDAETLAANLEGRLKSARYMEQDCQFSTFQGWEGFETQRCTYAVTDRNTGTQKVGLVVMLNPTAIQLSTWIINGCKAVRPDLPMKECSSHLVARVMEQSGGQFPVAGVVYEDIIPADHVFEAYGFRDGVTTVLDGVKHRGIKPLTSAELDAALTATPLRTASDGAFARIAGTSRNEYRWANPDADVEGLNWLARVRMLYQQAWRSDRNHLIEEWLRNNPPKAPP